MILDGVAGRLRREHNDRAWLAWHIEKLHRAKKLPKLETLQAKRPSRRQTWEEQLAIMQDWSARVNQAAAAKRK